MIWESSVLVTSFRPEQSRCEEPRCCCWTCSSADLNHRLNVFLVRAPPLWTHLPEESRSCFIFHSPESRLQSDSEEMRRTDRSRAKEICHDENLSTETVDAVRNAGVENLVHTDTTGRGFDVSVGLLLLIRLVSSPTALSHADDADWSVRFRTRCDWSLKPRQVLSDLTGSSSFCHGSKMASWMFQVWVVFLSVLISSCRAKRDTVLYCSACRAIVEEMNFSISQVDPKKTVNVGSFRLSPDGTIKDKKCETVREELEDDIIDLLKTESDSVQQQLCSNISGYCRDGGRGNEEL
ncbi:hypothetical protein WMY93_001017 [Mugilogobius chulae]|uniref:Saposin B-type domain-containing protein n=1 Tax=Mugilogobius chulae TaxID=88201 RepID=A0AAW0QFV7_9GOBI